MIGHRSDCAVWRSMVDGDCDCRPTPPPREPEDRYARPKDCRCGGLTEPCTPCLDFHRPSESEKCAGCAREDCVFPVVYSDAKPWPREPERKGTTRDCGHNYKFITDKGCSVCGPDPRDEALRLAEETLVRASRYWNSVPRFIEEALAAIRSIRKP